VWSVLESATSSDERNEPPSELEPGAASAIRKTLDGYYQSYMVNRGKKRWCDKSLDNLHFAKLIGQVFPDARFLCVHRHCMDVIASGVESSPWGLVGFGFSEYAREFPGNSVAAIGAYWMSNARRMLTFEREFPERCLRIRYEDLVSDPEDIASKVFDFIGAKQIAGISDWCLAAPHDRSGPGDQKIWFTSKISESSVGRGVRVPVKSLPPAALPVINESLVALGYRIIDEKWNLAVGNVDPREGFLQQQADDPESMAFRDAVFTLIQQQVLDGATAFKPENWPLLVGRHVHIAVEMAGCAPAELQLEFGSDGHASTPHETISQRNEPCALIVGSAASWRAILAGEANMAMEILSGRIRCASATQPNVLVSPEAHAVCEVLGLTASLDQLGRI
jgi:hypothetical protein